MVRHARDDGRVLVVTTWVPAGAAMVVQSLRESEWAGACRRRVGEGVK